MKKLSYTLIISFLIFSCNTENDFIENVPVNKDIDLSLTEYSDLNADGNAIFISGGVKGIIIYHGAGDNYKAYDRNCSYEPSLTCSRIDSINSGIAYCGCCTSAFLISNSGEPLNRPALLPLKAYNCILNENNILRIFN